MREVIEGNNKYCGPATLSILAGVSTDEAERAIRRIQPNYNGREVMIGDLVKAIKSFNIQAELIPELDNASLFSTFTNISQRDGMYLILVPKHVVCAEVLNKKITFNDNHTKTPISAESSARLGQRALQVYRIKELPAPKTLETQYVTSIYKVIQRVIKFDNGSESRDTITIFCHE